MQAIDSIVTVTMNTAIDRVVEVPGFAVGSHLPGRLLARYAAGKGVNVTRALAAMGRRGVASGFVGSGDAALFAESLHAAGAREKLVRVDGRTRENITIVDPVGQTDTHIREAGFAVTPADLARLEETLVSLAGRGTLIVFAGSLPTGMGADALASMVRRCGAAGAQSALDLSGRALRETLASAGSGVLAIKPNRRELAEMLGVETVGDDALIDAARRACDRSRWVLASLGEAGAVLVSRDRAWRGRLALPPGPPGRIVSTVGCGDCLLAGFLDGLASGRSPDAALRRGLAAAAANALDAGIARFTAEQVETLEPEAVVTAI